MQITAKEILESLSHETLSFMAESNHSNGTIAATQVPKVIGRVNAVLRRLSVRFVLKEKVIRVNVSTGRRYYPLTQGATWIVADPAEPFTGDVSRILGIEAPTGRMHDLGDKASLKSILLRDDGKSFALDSTLPNGVYSIIYKAATPQFTPDVAKLDQKLDIPEALLNALYLGVAAITYEGIGGPENLAMARDKWSQYEKECGEAKINSAVEIEESDEGNKLLDRGFC